MEQPLLQVIEERLSYRFRERSCVTLRGRVSTVVAFLNACKLIEQGCSKVLIAGIDSYLTAVTLAAYRGRDRLLGSHYQGGLIPGEGTVAVLVTATRASEGSQLLCLGLGFGVEKATVESEDLPLRADGLAQAAKTVFADCRLGYEFVDYRLTDLPGEQHCFKRATLALSRTLRVCKECVELRSLAGYIGGCGAMTGPALLCIAFAASHKEYVYGPQVPCHLGNDTGERVVVTLDYQ